MAQRPEQLIVWRREDGPGHDACGLWTDGDGWQLRGTAVFVFADIPCWLDYAVYGDRLWRTRRASVTGWWGHQAVNLQITAHEGGWQLNGEHQPAVDGCTDVDFSFTPATNLIPLRHLGLPVGAEAGAAAAWLNFPNERLVRLEQVYHRVADTTYDYRVPALGFAARLDVSPAGFVTHYGDLWTCEAWQ